MSLTHQFKALIEEQLEADPSIITPSARFVEDLGADSLDIVELTMLCEEAFDILIPDEEVEHLDTVSKAQKYLERRLERKENPHSFLQLWVYEQAAFEVGLVEPLRHSASGQFRRRKVQKGDTLWIVAVDTLGVLFLVGRLLVGEMFNREKAVERFGDSIYKADWHVAAEADTEELPVFINLMDIVEKLRFESSTGKDRLQLENGCVNAQQLETLRLLNADSVRLLEHKWQTTETPNADIIERQIIKHGAGFGSPERNHLVEEAAIEFVIANYEESGWNVISVEEERCGYDLLCTKGRQIEHVEVKGVSGQDPAFIITRGEVKTAKEDSRFVLCVITSALFRPRLRRYTGQEFLAQFQLRELAYRASLR